MCTRPINLFRERCISNILRDREKSITQAIDGWEDDRLLNADVEESISSFSEEYKLTPPVLHFDKRCFREPEHDFAEKHVALVVPYSGNADMLDIQPSEYMLRKPQAEVNEAQLTVYVPVGKVSTDDPVPHIESMLSFLQKSIDNLTKDCCCWNDRIEGIVTKHIQQRQKNIEERRKYYNDIATRMKND